MRRLLSVGSILCSALILAFLAGLWLYTRAHFAPGHPAGLGNFAETVSRIPPPGENGFRFVVLGDPEGGLGTYSHLVEKATAMGASFAVITGDVMARPTVESFELFEYVHAKLGPKALPTLVCAGNHDIAKGEDLRLFRRYLGLEVFSFTHWGCLFIFVDNNAEHSSEPVARIIRDILARQAEKPRHVFLVMHRPIIDYTKRGKSFQMREQSQPIFDLMDEGKVDTVLTGHAHSYARVEHDGKLILVTGGAGGHLYNPEDFFHMVLVDVGPSGVTETLVKNDQEPRKLDRMRFGLIVKLYPQVIGNPYVLIPSTAGAVCFLVLGSIGLFRRAPARAGSADQPGSLAAAIEVPVRAPNGRGKDPAPRTDQAFSTTSLSGSKRSVADWR
jgi:predicted phosphodiesterase